MAVHTVNLVEPIPEGLLAELHDKLGYASEHVAAFQIAADRSSIQLELNAADHAAQVDQAVRRVVGALVHGYRADDEDVIWRHDARRVNDKPIWDALVANGFVQQVAPGCVVLRGDVARLLEALDRVFVRIAERLFAAVPERYPTVLPMATLERCQYFASFPHHLTLAVHLRQDLAALSEVAVATEHERRVKLGQAMAPAGHVLSPSICFHTYALLADRAISSPLSVTAAGRCFRWEAGNLCTLERLWDFTMREIVFVGSGEWVAEQRRRAMAEVRGLVTALDLQASIEAGNDPFFVDNFAGKRFHQRLSHAKYELRLALPYAGGSLAAASFNVHADFFGRAFDIRHGNDVARTACVGFGLERWAWALLAQHGPRLSDWPAPPLAKLGL